MVNGMFNDNNCTLIDTCTMQFCMLERCCLQLKGDS